jgi:peptidoglycan/LPS O-acetylase OafA/YrhL
VAEASCDKSSLMLRSRLLVLCIVLLGISARPAGAADWEPNPYAGAPDSWPPGGQERWYGYQTLLADAASLTIGAVAFSRRNTPNADRDFSPPQILGLVSLVTYLLGSPGIHLLHGRTAEAGNSLALRIGLTAGAALISYVLLWNWSYGCSGCAYAAAVVSGAAVVTPIAIDAFSRDRLATPSGFAFRF